MKKNNKIVLFLFIIVIASCNNVKSKMINQNTKEISFNQLDKEVLSSIEKMKKNYNFDRNEKVILLKLYNTLHDSKVMSNENNKFFLRVFKDEYMPLIISEFDFKIGKGMALYSKTLDMHVFPSNEVTENDIYNLIENTDSR
ncbi:hypothetical protein [uncultured Psychroserpens sp.]|uniref:hypothetical protein n=1 Tax=uncultured Psychroserpens sp. TaxID=255436 RepID=UPI00262D45D1|nr:hypothetical protein [uncultured Psychroserpens sp.]